MNIDPLGIIEKSGPPTMTAPGDATAPGPTLASLTPVFTWLNASDPIGVGLYIRDLTANLLVYPNASRTTTTPLTGTSFVLPGAFLADGHACRAGLTSCVGTDASAQSGYRYFRTPAFYAGSEFFRLPAPGTRCPLTGLRRSYLNSLILPDEA